MNILIMPSWYPNGKNVITGSFFREQAISLLKYGHRVIVLDTTLQGRENYCRRDVWGYKHYFDDGIEVFAFRIPALGLARTKRGGLDLYKAIAERVVEKIISMVGLIDIIHAHSYLPAGFSACMIGKKRGIPVVVTEHSSSVLLYNMGREQEKILCRTVEEASRFICVSNKLKQSVLQITKTMKVIEVIPNSVSDIFATDVYKEGENKFIFMSVGHLVRGKRHDLSIMAFKNAFGHMKNVMLHIVGSGPCREELERLIKMLELESQVKLLGGMTRTQVAENLRQCDVFLLPSAYETFGIVYVEALASGVPIIGTRNGGAEDIIEADNGLLIDVDDQGQLEEAMLYMYKNIDKYDRKKISQGCQLKYGEHIITERLMQVYDDIRK